LADVRHPSTIDGADPPIPLSGDRQAQQTVGTTPDLIGMRIVLAIVFPETDGTNLISSALAEGDASTARTGIRTAGRMANYLGGFARLTWSRITHPPIVAWPRTLGERPFAHPLTRCRWRSRKPRAGR
jgi:hypothetical protein